MAHSESSAIQKIKAYMLEWGGHPNQWYVGRTADPEGKLFDHFGVDREFDAWVILLCLDEDAARRTVEFSMRVLGTDGDKVGTEELKPTMFVIAYRKMKGVEY